MTQGAESAVPGRRNTDAELKASLKEIGDLKSALDQHAIVAITDPKGKIVYVNDKFCAISQYARGELIGQDHRIINSGHHPKGFFQTLWATIAGGRVWKGEIKNRAKDGSFYWVDTTIVPFLNDDGTIRQHVAIRADITERKKAEAELLEKEERFRTMANSIPQLAWIARGDGNITWYNRRWHEYTGKTLAEMEGWGWQSVHDPAVLPLVVERWKAAIESGQPFDMEFPLLGADGRFRTFLTRIEPLKDSEGRVVNWFGTNTDVESLKAAEDKVHRLNAELERRVAERTAQLETANRELEAFSYSVSHDLRAPLRAVNGFAGIVVEDFGPQLPAEAQRYLGLVRESALKMGMLIDDLLMFSRLSRQPLNKQTVEMDELVRSTLGEMQAEQGQMRARVIPGNLPPCEGDRALLKQVWVNLLSNAFKYSRKREQPVVEIGGGEQDGELVYFVRDNGSGFDMRYVGKLFGVFQRLHRAEDYEGTGVGLAIVQRILQRHGGRVWASAAVDQGATFYFALPRREAP